jgi:hypothetical protein
VLFLVDEDVPSSAVEFLAARGHRLCLVTDVLLPGSPDAIVARWADESAATILTCNGKHFIPLLSRASRHGPRKFRRAGLAVVPRVRSRERRADFVDLIELEDERPQRNGDRRVLIDIRDTTVRILR